MEGGRRPSLGGVPSVRKEREPVRRVSGNWGAALELGLCLSTADPGRPSRAAGCRVASLGSPARCQKHPQL